MKFVSSAYDLIYNNGKQVGVMLEVSMWTNDGEFVDKKLIYLTPDVNGEYKAIDVENAVIKAETDLRTFSAFNEGFKDFGEVLRRVRAKRNS